METNDSGQKDLAKPAVRANQMQPASFAAWSTRTRVSSLNRIESLFQENIQKAFCSRVQTLVNTNYQSTMARDR